MNHELRTSFDSPSIPTVIESKHIGWVGHVKRNINKRVMKKALYGKLERKIHCGRPKSSVIVRLIPVKRERGKRNKHSKK